MLQNKIYLNFFKEIFKTFFIILFGLSIIALTVRAVNFLDLIVENGYPVSTYFKYSLLNLFGLAPKFIPFSFLLALTIFILKHIQDSEFIILWTSGVKKIQVVNLLLGTSLIVLIFYIIFSTLLTPFALNKSRQLLSQESLNTFLPTIKTQQFSDSFTGFTFIVEKKINNEIQNIFLHDTGGNLKGLSSNISKTASTTIVAKSGIVEQRKMFLFNGQIISSKADNKESEIIKFEQLNIDLRSLTTTTIKKPKLQETSTLILLNCFINGTFINRKCGEDLKKEIIPVLNRRLILPFYIPVITLICSLLLIKNKKLFLSKTSIFIYSFLLLLFTELTVRYTGINSLMKIMFIFLPFIMLLSVYLILAKKFKNEFN